MQNETKYRSAKGWQVLLAPASNCIPTMFTIIMMFASYAAVGIYGATTVLAGTIITGTRMFDAVTDPLIAIFAERLNGKLGRARPLLVTGWIISSLCILSMFRFGIGGGENRVWAFTLIYCIYIVGYTIFGIGNGLVQAIMTNDPKQRPKMSMVSTVYVSVFSTLISVVLAATLMPKYNYQMGLPLFSDLSIIVVCVTGVLALITVVTLTIAKVDIPETYVGKIKEKPKFKDIISLLKSNRALQMYVVAAASDKLAMQTSANSAITVMLFGIILGNYSFSAETNTINMVVTLVLLIFFVGRLAGNSGLKKAIIQWTIIASVLYCVMWVFMGSVDTLSILGGPLKYIFIGLFAAMNAARTACTCVTEPARYDVVDYELSKTGKYSPAIVTSTYTFIDKMVSSFSTTIVALTVATIGYTTTMPQATDPLTTPLFNVTMFLWLGVPILGWICTLIAMRFYPLDKEKMIEVQKINSEIRSAN